jgi:leader peptidase (prepilin peptidase)/N-methyltransferase
MQLMLLGFVGWFAGAVVNYLSDVLPRYRKFVHPVCLHCETQMEMWNYWLWPRRCTRCGRPRTFRVWVVEIIYILVAIWLWTTPQQSMNDWLGLLLWVYLGIVTVIDIEHRLILHPVSLFGAILGLIVGTQLHGLKSTLLGGLAGFAFMLGIYMLGFLFLRLSNRWRGKSIGEDEALGFGDVNLSGVIGLILGWPGILAGLVLAILFAGAISLIYLLFFLAIRKTYRPGLAVPYGPFLVLSALVLLFFKGILWF